MVDEAVTEVVANMRHGVIAVDANLGHRAITIVDLCGNRPAA